MKKTTKKVAMIGSAIVAVSIASELPAIINPTPLSKARERALIKIVGLTVGITGAEVFAKE